MKVAITLFATAALSLLASNGYAQQPAPAQEAPDQTVSILAGSASRQLEKSSAELNELRAQIAREKLPLAQELTVAEEKINTLRKDSDQLQRKVDAGALELTAIRSEIKARQEELVYIGNILDEYARGMEGKVNIAEMQLLAPVILKAKQAGENATLPQSERFSVQTDFVAVTVARLMDLIGGTRFNGIAVDLQGTVLDGQFMLMGPVALFRAASGVAGMVVPQTGSDKPLVRPLEDSFTGNIGSLVMSGEGMLPFDPSRGGALKALVQKTSLIHIFEKGGPIMWPLLVSSILALGAVLERLWFLMNEKRKRNRKALDQLFSEVARGNVDTAVRIGKESKDFVVRAMGYALERKDQSLSNALSYATAKELKRFKRSIPVLDTVITLAPLLGLLGTVTGMMGSFSLIGGELSAPGAITGGIAEALIATAFGLGIAITALLPFNFLNARLDDAEHELEAAATQIKLLAAKSGVDREAVVQDGKGGWTTVVAQGA
jgi:biopolymer transport protein ExbB